MVDVYFFLISRTFSSRIWSGMHLRRRSSPTMTASTETCTDSNTLLLLTWMRSLCLALTRTGTDSSIVWRSMKKCESCQIFLELKGSFHYFCSGDPPRSHYAFRNVYFLDDMEESKDKHQMTTSDLVPEHLHILRHTLRSANYSKKNEHVKSIVCPDQVTALHNHLPFS